MRAVWLLALSTSFTCELWAATVYAENQQLAYRYDERVSSGPPDAATTIARSTLDSYRDDLYVWNYHVGSAAILDPHFSPALHIYGSNFAYRTYSGSGVDLHSSALVSDNLHILDGPSQGTLQFLVAGSSSIDGRGASFSQLPSVSAYASTPSFSREVSNSGTAFYSTSLSDPIYFNFIAPGEQIYERSISIPFANSLASYSLALSSIYGCSDYSAPCSISVDDTLAITGVRILDSTGSPVTNLVVTADSGLDYLSLPKPLLDPVTIPEPPMFLTFGISLLVAAALKLTCKS